MSTNDKDKARLDWLDKQGQGMEWVSRPSSTGRGYRVHNVRKGELPDGSLTVREAIDKAMEASK